MYGDLSLKNVYYADTNLGLTVKPGKSWTLGILCYCVPRKKANQA